MDLKFYYEVGQVEDFSDLYMQKFILELEPASGTLKYHAQSLRKGKELYHADIAKATGITEEVIVGGGRLGLRGARAETENDYMVQGTSTFFGSVPDEILQQFLPLLTTEYKAKDATLTKIILFSDDRFSLEDWIARHDILERFVNKS